jgi:phosphatidylinositol-4,5-bisphosphate 3-kinase
MHNAHSGGAYSQAIFKNGDDLRQDILTLQIITVMDKIWLDNGMDLKMTPYKVVGTHCMQGFMEFNQNCATIAAMQYVGTIPVITKKANVFKTFNNETVMKFMVGKTRDRLRKDMEDKFKEQ